MNTTIFMCEDSIDGIFTGIYDAWDSKLGHANVKLEVAGIGNMELFSTYVYVPVDVEKARKVTKTIYKRLGDEAYQCIITALYSWNAKKADAVYRTIVAGLSLSDGTKIMDNLSNPSVFTVFELSRSVGNESHHYLGFVRFSELFNGVLLSVIKPQNNLLALIAPHFADRLPCENWAIYDEVRELFLVHEAHKQWAIVSEPINKDMIHRLSTDELEFRRLWVGFCNSISIKERENPNLQRNNMPIRYRSNMHEFQS